MPAAEGGRPAISIKNRGVHAAFRGRMIGFAGVERRPETEHMEAFYQRLIERAATIDELLSDDFEPLPGRKDDSDLAARRLAAWCRSCANGDWALFGRRLERDGLSFGHVLSRFATVRRKASAPPPLWIDDAIWIETALRSATPEQARGAASG